LQAPKGQTAQGILAEMYLGIMRNSHKPRLAEWDISEKIWFYFGLNMMIRGSVLMNVEIPNLQIPGAEERSSGRWCSKEGSIILFGSKIWHIKIGPGHISVHINIGRSILKMKRVEFISEFN